MVERRMEDDFGAALPLLNLLEQRFSLQIRPTSIDHLREIHEHYRRKREILLYEHGEAGAIALDSYAKAFLISEAARMLILREIDPSPRKKKRNKKDRK